MPIGTLKMQHKPSSQPKLIISTIQMGNFIMPIDPAQISEAMSHIGEKVEYTYNVQENHGTITQYFKQEQITRNFN